MLTLSGHSPICRTYTHKKSRLTIDGRLYDYIHKLNTAGSEFKVLRVTKTWQSAGKLQDHLWINEGMRL